MRELNNPNLFASFEQGIEALKQNDPLTAILHFKDVLNEKDDDVPAHYQLANAYIKCENWEEAERHLDCVMSLVPHWPHGFFSAGNVAAAQGHNDDALGFFTLALARGFPSRQGRLARGMALYGCGRLAEAIDDFDAVLVEEMDEAALKYRMACLLGLHRYQEALVDVDVLLDQAASAERRQLEEIRTVCLQQTQARFVTDCIDVTELPS